MLTIAPSINMGSAVLKTLLVSFDLRSPTVKLWLPSSCQAAFKPSLIAVFIVPFDTFPGTSSFKGSGPHRAIICLTELAASCRYQHVFLFPCCPVVFRWVGEYYSLHSDYGW